MPNVRRPGTGYVNIGDVLRLNQGAAQGMTNNLTDRVAGSAEAAVKPINDSVSAFAPTRDTNGSSTWETANASNMTGWQSGLEEAGSRVNALGSNAGRVALMNDYYGRGTTGGRRLDSALMGLTSNPKAKDVQRRYQNIGEMLGTARDQTNGAQQQYNQQATEEDEAKRKEEENRNRQDSDAGVTRNPIQTPGTMPDPKQPKKARDSWFGHIMGYGKD